MSVDAAGAFGPRIDARHHLATDRATFLRLLTDLAPDDWERPTAAAPWTVRDVVAHVLGDDLGRLARARDGHTAGGPKQDESFPAFIHRQNDEWVRAAARLSPRLLLDLLHVTSPQVQAHWNGVDLDLIGSPVTWAGPGPAPVWLDCARDFTEYGSTSSRSARRQVGRVARIRRSSRSCWTRSCGRCRTRWRKWCDPTARR